MKRTYRVTVVVERDYERKATGEAKAVRYKLLRAVEETGWSVARTSITNRARPDRKAPDEDPAKVYEEMALGQALATLREIATDMAAILGNVKKPRVYYAPNRWCDGGFTHNTAHAHTKDGWSSHARRRVQRGLICISPRHILMSSGKNWPWLMAHEIVHIRMPGGSHRRAKFAAAVDALLKEYESRRGGGRESGDVRLRAREAGRESADGPAIAAANPVVPIPTKDLDSTSTVDVPEVETDMRQEKSTFDLLQVIEAAMRAGIASMAWYEAKAKWEAQNGGVTT